METDAYIFLIFYFFHCVIMFPTTDDEYIISKEDMW